MGPGSATGAADLSTVPELLGVVFDVDGTLLKSDGTLPQGVIQACRAAERAGVCGEHLQGDETRLSQILTCVHNTRSADA